MRFKKILVLSIILFCFLNGCSNYFDNKLIVKDFHRRYKERIASYPEELTNHFSQKIPQRGFSFRSPTPSGYYALHYSGFELFINYNDDTEKDFF